MKKMKRPNWNKEIVKTFADSIIGSMNAFGFIQWGLDPLFSGWEILIILSCISIAFVLMWIIPDADRKVNKLGWHLVINTIVSIIIVYLLSLATLQSKFIDPMMLLVVWGMTLPIVVVVDKILK